VPEQTAALRGLLAIGGPEAATAVIRIITGRAVQGPGLGNAIAAAAGLRCRLPPDIAAAMLQHPEPAVRADAASCAPPQREVIARLVDLLDDLNGPVATAAACALGRMGRAEARQMLVRRLCEEPSPEVIDAIVPIADEVCIVTLGRIARSMPDLAAVAVAALDDIDDDRAAAVAFTVRRIVSRRNDPGATPDNERVECD
jgi:hypothetical protein